MALADQTASERLLSRLHREHVTPSSHVLSRLERHSQPGVIARGSDRAQRTTASRQRAGYAPPQSGSMLSRLVARAGLRPAPDNVGIALSSLSTDFVVATPPWLARAAEVPAGQSPVRRRQAQRSTVPVIDGWGAVQAVPGSSPVARRRAGALSRASGISPPTLEGPQAPLARAPRSAETPAAGLALRAAETAATHQPAPAPTRNTRSSFVGRPLSRTVAAVQAAASPNSYPTASSTSSTTRLVRAPREQGSSRELGRGFSVARATAGHTADTELVFPTAAPRAISSRNILPAEAVTDLGTQPQARRAQQQIPQIPPAHSSVQRAATRAMTTAPSASPLARAVARSGVSIESGSMLRHGAGAARRVATLASSALALTEAMPAPTRRAAAVPMSTSRPLTRQATPAHFDTAQAHLTSPTPAQPSYGLSSAPTLTSSPSAHRSAPSAHRSAPTALARAIRSQSGPASGPLAHLAARATAADPSTSSPPSAGLLARSFGRALPAPLEQSQRPRAAQLSSFELTAPSASRQVAAAPTGPPALAPAAAIAAATSTSRPKAHRSSSSSPSSRALARLSVISPSSETTGASLSGSLTSPLTGSPVARTLARFGGADSSHTSGVSRTRSLSASAELGMAPPLRRANPAAAVEHLVAAPAAPRSAIRRNEESITTLNAPISRSISRPSTRQAESALAHSGSSARAATVAPTRAAIPTRPQATSAAARRSQARSPLSRAFARVGYSAATAAAAPTTTTRSLGTARSASGRSGRAVVTSFDAALPRPSGPLHRAAEVAVTGPGRGFTESRRAHRERSAPSSYGASLPSLTIGSAPVAFRSARAQDAVHHQPVLPGQPLGGRAARRDSPGARLVARGGATRWTTGVVPDSLLARAPQTSPRPSSIGTVTAGPSQTPGRAVRYSRSRADLPGMPASAPSLLGPQVSRTSEPARRATLPALSRLMQQGPELTPPSRTAAPRSTAITARVPIAAPQGLTRSARGSRSRRAGGAESLPAAGARRTHQGASSDTQQLLQRIVSLKPGESIGAVPEDTLADAGAMITQAVRALERGEQTTSRSLGRSAGAARSSRVARREGFATRANSLVDASQLENLVRKELTTLSAPRPILNDTEIVRLAREALVGQGRKGVARKEAGGAPAGGDQQKDLDDLLHRLIRRMLIDEQIGGERILAP